MKLKCTFCGESIPPENINLAKTVALCPKCGNVFDFTPFIARRKLKPRKVKQPVGVRLEASPDELTLIMPSIPQRGFYGLFLRALTLLMTFGPILLLGRALLAQPITTSDEWSLWLMLPVVLFSFYFGLAILVGRWEVSIDRSAIKQRFRPLPLYFSSRRLATDKVVEVSYRSISTASILGGERYEVVARDEDDRTHMILRNFLHPMASYIAQELDAFLQEGREDTPMADIDTGADEPSDRLQELTDGEWVIPDNTYDLPPMTKRKR